MASREDAPTEKASESAPPAKADSATSRFGYFVLQAAVPLENAARAVRVVLEDLASGEKHSFSSSRALASYLDTWAGVLDENTERSV